MRSKTHEPMDRHGLLGKSQYASYEGESCLSNHKDSLEEMNMQVGKGNPSDILGFSKNL